MSDDSLREELQHIGTAVHAVQADLDAGDFAAHLDHDDLLALLLRAHLWVERELTAIIEAPLRHPERLRARWSYVHRLEFVAALGILDEEDLPAYRYLDELRNRVAHRFNYAVSGDEEAAMLRKLRPQYRTSVEATTADKPFPEPLKQALRMLVVTLMLKRKGMMLDQGN